MEKKKRRFNPILFVIIPLVLILIAGAALTGLGLSRNAKYEKALELLDDGQITDAIAIHQELGQYKDLDVQICDAAASHCKKLLEKGEYEKVPKLYQTVSAYPESAERLNQPVRAYAETALLDYDAETVVSLWESFAQDENLRALLQDQIAASAPAMFEESSGDYMYFYQLLMEEDIRLDALDACVAEYLCRNIRERDYTDVYTYYHILPQDSAAMEQVYEAFVDNAKDFLDQNNYAYVMEMYSWMQSFDAKIEDVSQQIYDHACVMLEQQQYGSAQDYFYLLSNNNDPWYREDADYMYKLSLLQYYIANRWFEDARYLVDRYAGETHEKLLAALMEHCGDQTAIADLEAAILARLALEETDASDQMLLDAEWEILHKYRDMYFYDQNLWNLMMDYMDALDHQSAALDFNLGSAAYYDYYFHWYLAEAERCQILDRLHQEYGFGKDSEQLQSMLGIGDYIEQWIYAWDEIHTCLEYALWNVAPYQEGNRYYLDVYNYTDYTFSFQVYQQFCDESGNILADYLPDAFTLAPGESMQMLIAYPAGSVAYWFIDWNIFDIYLGDEWLG